MKDDKKLKKEYEENLDKVLNILYSMEDYTDYENKNISGAINLLQKELK